METNKLKKEIDKYYSMNDEELVTESGNKVKASESNSERSKVQGIGEYYKTNKKLTEGQRESLVRFLARTNTFNNN